MMTCKLSWERAKGQDYQISGDLSISPQGYYNNNPSSIHHVFIAKLISLWEYLPFFSRSLENSSGMCVGGALGLDYTLPKIDCAAADPQEFSGGTSKVEVDWRIFANPLHFLHTLLIGQTWSTNHPHWSCMMYRDRRQDVAVEMERN